MIDVLGPEKRRRRTTQEKIAIVQQSFEPGMTVSLVARQHGVAASQLFLWRKQYQEGSLTAVAAGEQVVPASELAAAMKQIKELGVTPIDIVAINLYPFKATILKEPPVSLEEAIENIDIGGPTMIRAAAKNWQDVAVIVDPTDYA